MTPQAPMVAPPPRAGSGERDYMIHIPGITNKF